MKRLLFQTDLRQQLTMKVEARLATFKVKTDDERVKLEKALTTLEAEAARLVTFIRTTDLSASPDSLEMVRSSLEEVTRKQRDLKAKLAGLKAATEEPRLPTVEEITAYVLDVEARLRDDPTTARSSPSRPARWSHRPSPPARRDVEGRVDARRRRSCRRQKEAPERRTVRGFIFDFFDLFTGGRRDR